MRYSDEYINKFRVEIEALGFTGIDFIRNLTNDQIRDNINGIGCASMNERLRNALDNLHPSMVYASHVHDLSWTFRCSGSDGDFYQSNSEFEANTIVMAHHLYSWYDLRRYWSCHKAKQYRRILDAFGHQPYLVTERK